MATFEEIKRKHERYTAIASGYNNQIGKNLAFLNNVRKFMDELNEAIKQKKVFNSKQRANFQVWFRYWLRLAEPYR